MTSVASLRFREPLAGGELGGEGIDRRCRDGLLGDVCQNGFRYIKGFGGVVPETNSSAICSGNNEGSEHGVPM